MAVWDIFKKKLEVEKKTMKGHLQQREEAGTGGQLASPTDLSGAI